MSGKESIIYTLSNGVKVVNCTGEVLFFAKVDLDGKELNVSEFGIDHEQVDVSGVRLHVNFVLESQPSLSNGVMLVKQRYIPAEYPLSLQQLPDNVLILGKPHDAHGYPGKVVMPIPICSHCGSDFHDPWRFWVV